MDHGLEGGPSAICRHGRDLDGSSASVEDSVDGSGATHTIIHGSAQGSHGFQDGGGLTLGIGPTPGTGIDRLTLAMVGGATGILS